MKKLLVSLMLIISGIVAAQNVTILDPSQTYNTGNLVNNTTSPTSSTGLWQNVGSWNQGLPCWSPQDGYNGAYCGPTPYFNNGSFNFSYGVTDVHQYVSIANALPNSGTGLRVNGYNFGFMAKNGNGWDGAGLDTLSAYVTFYGSDGKSVRNDYYNLNYQFDWTVFNYGKTFDTPYANKDLSTVRYGFIGGDTSNYWAGPYGPEVTNISFSLNYSVDPCYNNPLYSPTCPGYLDALNKLIQPTSIPNSVDITSNTQTPTATITTSIVADPVSPTVTVTSTPTQQQSQGSINNTSLGLSIIARNQQREQNIVNQAVQNAITTATTASNNAQQEAMSIAANAVANSTSSSSSIMGSTSGVGIRLSNSQSSSNSQSNDLSIGLDNSAIRYNNFLTDRTNPLNEYIEARPSFNQSSNIGPTVNRNASNNEIAGNVDITKMAVIPNGYDSYLNLVMKDVAFYTPKEVYKNQKNVDNMRVLRQLTSDSKHNEMVDQQYRR
jgi:hypothetical protein